MFYAETDNDFIKEVERRQHLQEQADSVVSDKDNTGELSTGVDFKRKDENAGPDGANEVPAGDYVGELAPQQTPRADEATAVTRGFLATLFNMLAPQPLNGAGKETVEFPQDSATAAQLEQLRASLRYLGTTAMKVTETPARHILFPSANVGTAATQIAGYQPTRKRLVIKNVGSNSVYLGDSSSITTGEGYELEAADAPLEIFSQGEIWAISAADGERVEMVAEHYA